MCNNASEIRWRWWWWWGGGGGGGREQKAGVTGVSGLPPPYPHPTSNQKQDGRKAWEQGSSIPAPATHLQAMCQVTERIWEVRLQLEGHAVRCDGFWYVP